MGKGFGDWPLLIKSLKDMRYDGAISFHSEYGGETVETVIDLARIDVRFITALLEEA